MKDIRTVLKFFFNLPWFLLDEFSRILIEEAYEFLDRSRLVLRLVV